MPETGEWAEVLRNAGTGLRDLRTTAGLTKARLIARMGDRSDGTERRPDWVSQVEGGGRSDPPLDQEDLSSWLTACQAGARRSGPSLRKPSSSGN